ncbi:GNAT family N-acetyltransferase [uncultured Thiocystis sp.]|jgi:hypothetical protein|uniref:GNAT family N-acetyltransferase n=1 Tax=uncultured Thiocystis sp. TaxID=1202134 RepID=UPI0025E7E8AC|nr:GNAT family N-acetyltransferase [uncultured Thiocystis sp.]
MTRLGEQLIRILPETTGALLLVGPASEGLAPRLRDAGHRVVEAPLSPDDRMALARGELPQAFLSAGFAPVDDGLFEAILVLDHRLPLPPLALLNAAHDRLRTGGMLVISMAADSFPADPAQRRSHLGYLGALATRCGFIVEDRSEDQHPSTALVVCRKGERAPRWRLDLLDEGAIAGFADLFRKAFNTDISLPLWHWKYGDGRGHGIIARRDERVIAHYGCTRRRALFFGHPISALQMCDVMVDPRERGVMTKQGAMFLTTATMLELYLALQPDDLAFGFPSSRSSRLGERLGLYAEVGRIAEIRWPAVSTRPRLRTRLRAIDRDDSGDRALIAGLWSSMSRDLEGAIVVIRDWEYLRYRYLDHPQHRYELILMTSRLTGRPLGLLVLRQVGEAFELLDLVGPLAHIPLLVDQARRIAARAGACAVFAWITRQHVPRFITKDATVTDPDVCIPTNVWVDGPRVEQLQDKWWLMSGDTEFH